jgi:thiopeptide-type bacteriocin biosynthesis protein
MFQHYKTDFFFLRTPLYPLEKLRVFYDQLAITGETRKKELFSDILNEPTFREALFLASPDFYQQIQRYLEGKITDARQIAKIEWSLLKYYTRSCYRCTPFGIFAAGSMGSMGDHTSITFDNDQLERHVRLDMSYLYDIMMKLLEKEETRRNVTFVPNKTIYEVGDHLRYIEVRYESPGVKKHTIAEIARNPVLLSVLKACIHGSTYQALTAHVGTYGVDEASAVEFINTLIREQLLVMELEPNVSGNGYLQEMLATLAAGNINPHITTGLQEVLSLSEAVKHTGEWEGYQALLQVIAGIHPPAQENQVLQVDAFRRCTAGMLDTTVATRIKDTLSVLAKLGASGSAARKMAAFKEAFQQKYDRQSIPLLKALDPEIGIDYKKIAVSGAQMERNEPVSRYKVEKYTEAMLRGQFEVELKTGEMEQLESPAPAALPDSLYVIFKLMGDANTPAISLSAASGPSAANLLGRFCHMDASLETAVKDLLTQEESLYPDKIFAEIVHLPQPRIGNILARPHLRLYEIPFLARSTRPYEYQLPLADLYLKIAGDRVVLFSKKLGKEIVPRLATAHNFSSESTLAVYNFLCDLQLQGLSTVLGWSWEHLVNEPFLPRVRYQQTIVSPARWNIKKEHLLAGQVKISIHSFQQYLVELRQQQYLPRYAEYGEGDNKLLLDLFNETVISFLYKELEQHGIIKLVESIGLDETSPVMVNHKQYNNEFIVPFVRSGPIAKIEPPVVRTHQLLANKVPRTFIPGSTWLYFKLYTGTRYADTLLCYKIYALVNKLKKRGIISKCFFIRYYDPGFHLRIRWLLKRKEGFPEALAAIYAAFDKETGIGKISRVVLDTYEREVERYGEKTMLLSEAVFDLDSACVLALLRNEQIAASDNRKMMAGLSGLAYYLEGLGLGMEQRLYLCRNNFSYLCDELGKEGDAEMKVALDKKYRMLQKEINTHLDIHLPPETPEAQIVAAHYPPLKALLYKIGIATGKTRVYPTATHLAGSYFHMFINRLFPENQRQAECELYYYAGKYYASIIARTQKRVSPQTQ